MNVFTSREKRLIPNDLRLLEQRLSIQLPEDLKEHYLQSNGGTPTEAMWFDTVGAAEPVEVRHFFPIRYCKAQADAPAFTLEGIASRMWACQQLPRNCLPFAIDTLENYFCVERTSGSVFYVDATQWRSDNSPQQNWDASARHLARSFTNFVDNLKPPAKQATVPMPSAVVEVAAPLENMFRQCERPMMDWDFAWVESTLHLSLPWQFKSHYRRYNGGVPDRTVWVDPVDASRSLTVAHFLPLRTPPGMSEGSIATVITCAEMLWESGRLPRNLLPFGLDVSGNFLSLNPLKGEVSLLLPDDPARVVSILSKRESTRHLSDSLPQFVDGLQPARAG